MILPGQMKVLIVEDNPGDAFLVKEYLNATDIQIDEIHWASGWNEAVEVLESVVIAIVLLDLNLSDSQGLETFQKFKSIAPNIPVVVLSGHQDKVIAIETMKMGAQDYLVKGTFNAILLGKAINYAIERSCYIKSLWQKEEEYKYLFDNNPNPLLTWEIANLQFSMVNQAAIDFYGLTTTEFLSLKVTDLFEGAEIKSEDLVSKSHFFGKKHIKAGKQLCYVDLVLKDAEIHGIHSRIMLVNDVTQKHLTMEKLIESEQQLRKLAGNYPNGLIAIIDNQFIFHFIDGSELVKKGLAAKDMIGKCYTDFLDEANKQKFIENISKVFIGEQVVFYKEMAEETFLISASGLSNSNGEIVRAILVSQNITGNILAKKEILFQANILKNVIEAIVVKDINGNIVYFNESAEKLLGYPAELIEGKSLNDLIKNEKLDFNFEKILEETALNGTFKHEYRTKRADGREIVLETAQSFMNNEKGVPAFVIGISQDITDRIEAEKVLKDSEANLNAIFRSTTQSFILMDVDTRIVAFNENGSNALLKFFNKQIKKGDYFRSLIWDSRLKIFENHIREVLDQKMVRFEEKFNFNGEKEVYLELTYSPVMKDDAVIGIVLCGENITERYRSEEFLLKSEQKYRELVETSIDMIWTIDKAGKVVFVNKAANEILGWETVDIIGKNFVDFVGPTDVENVSQHIYEALLSNKQYSNYESTILRKDGAIANVITHAVVNHDEATGNSWLTGTTRDITERVKAERELSYKNEQLKMLSSYLQTIREEERKHIAREIHDELGQQLTGLKMDLAFLNRKFGEANSEFSDKLTEMMKLVDGSIRTIRQISSDLRPGILDDLGLIPAIEWQGSEFEKRTNIKCLFLNKINESNIDESFATGVFRILQESLTNISRHSGASNVVVEIDQVENSIVLKISDNGKGFIQDKLAVKTTFGLVGMEERAAMLNGALTIVSTPEIGTEVKLIFPAKKVELEKV